MLDKILARTDVKELLHKALTDTRFNSKDQEFSPNSSLFIYNLYSVIIAMDSIIKFSIIVDDDKYVEEFIGQLRRMLKRLDTKEDLMYGESKLLCQIVSRILNIEDIDDYESKKQIISYIYDKYIVNGYMFYSFNSKLKDKFLLDGIDPRNLEIPYTKLRQVSHIFNDHGYLNLIRINYEDDVHIEITSSPGLAYLKALASPSYISDLCTNKEYMNDDKYDKGAIYRKDYEACRNNIIKFCKNGNYSLKDMTIIMNLLVTEWNRLDITASHPAIAFIKRSALGRNYLKDFRQILLKAEKQDVAKTIQELMEDKNEFEIRYTPITKNEMFIRELPSYEEIYNELEAFVFQSEKQIILNEDYMDDFKEEIYPNYLHKALNSYGKSTILGLLGILMITLGATLIILLTYYS